MNRIRITIKILLLVGTIGVGTEAHADFGLHAGLNWGLGKAGDSNRTILPRTINTLSFQAMPSYKSGPLMVGPFLQYGFTGQNTDTATVQDTNVKGSGYLLGLGGSYSFGEYFILGSFDFLGQYKLSQTTFGGLSSTYKSPIGFTLVGGYSVTPMVSADLCFALHSYKKSALGGTDVDISTNKFTMWTLGVGASIRYN